MSLLLADVSGADAAGAGIGIAVLLVILLASLAVLGWYIWILMDILKQPDYAWTAAQQNKQLWIILWVVGLCASVALIVGLIYQFAIRPKVKAAAEAGAGGYTGYAQ